MGVRGDIQTAVILAAGNGKRLATQSHLPKPLVRVGEKYLLSHILSRVQRNGIQNVIVVVGYRGDEIRTHIENESNGLKIDWVENPNFDLENGVSLLAVENRISSNFLLLMADHLFEPEILEQLLSQPIPRDGGVLASDEPGRVFDLADATKLRIRSGRITEIGKEIPAYNAIDTGSFLLTPAVFRAMRTSAARGKFALTDGITQLVAQSRVDSWSIQGRRWIDVDTPDALEEARRLYSKSAL